MKFVSTGRAGGRYQSPVRGCIREQLNLSTRKGPGRTRGDAVSGLVACPGAMTMKDTCLMTKRQKEDAHVSAA